MTGKEVLDLFAALASPHRIRIIAVLAGGRQYVSQLAREIGMSRPLLHMHLQKLEAARLVVGHLELSPEGKAMKYFELRPFRVSVTPTLIAQAATTLPPAQSAASEGEL
jgi:ArsR family transcriptional regulator